MIFFSSASRMRNHGFGVRLGLGTDINEFHCGPRLGSAFIQSAFVCCCSMPAETPRSRAGSVRQKSFDRASCYHKDFLPAEIFSRNFLWLFQSTSKQSICQVAELLMPREWCRTLSKDVNAPFVGPFTKSVRQSWSHRHPRLPKKSARKRGALGD